MASQFLNFLDNIDKGRKACISELQGKGFDISNDASLDRVATSLKMIPSADVNNMDNLNDYITYYDNPLDDPELWQYPTDWPNCKEIFTNLTDITDDSGSSYYPCWMCLIDNEHENTLFTVYKNALEEKHAVYVDYVSTSYSSKYAYKFLIKTSDGAQYALTSDDYQSEGHNHTWDSSKDINNKYRYFIVYRTASSSAQQIRDTSFFNVNVLAFLTGAESYEYQGLFRTGLALDKMLYFYKTAPFTELGKSFSYTSSGNGKLSDTRVPNLKYIEENDNRLNRYFDFDASNATTVITNNPRSIINIQNFHNAIYIKAPVVTGSLTYRKLDTYEESGNPRNLCKLKYLENDDTEMKNYYSGLNSYGFGRIPFLQHPERLTKYIKSIHTQNNLDHSDFLASFINSKYLDLSSLESINGRYAIDHTYAEIIDLSSLKVIPSGVAMLLEAGNCHTLLLDNLEEILNYQFLIPRSVIKLNLPKLHTCKGTFGNSDVAYSKMLELHVPSLTAVTNEKTFYYLTMLHILELPNNFAYSLDLASMSFLRHDCVIDIFNKMADLTNTDKAYSLRLYETVYDKLSEEELSIATNKGWTIIRGRKR